MLSGFIIAIALVLGGLAVMRFGIFQIRKFKKGETRVTKKVSEQLAFIIFLKFRIILPQDQFLEFWKNSIYIQSKY